VTPGLLLGLHLCNAFALTPGLPSSWPATLQPLCLGREPKARVATIYIPEVVICSKKTPEAFSFA